MESGPVGGATQRVAVLDGLRGVSILLVVAYHFLARGPQLYPDALGAPVGPAELGREGVLLFFLISGFVVPLSLRRSSPGRFALSRAIRLLPTYWLGVALTFVIVTATALPGRAVPVVDALVNATMLQAFLGYQHVDGAYWTLGIELCFYVMCATLWFLGRLRADRLPMTLYVWLAITAVAIVTVPAQEAAWRQLTDNLPWFLLGIAALAIFEGDRRPSLLLFPVVGIAAVGLAAPRTAVLGALVFILFMAALRWQPRVLGGRWLVFFGHISYPLYVLHQNVGYVLLLAFVGLGAPRWVALTLTTLVVLVAAALVTHAYDRPIRRTLRARLLTRRAELCFAR